MALFEPFPNYVWNLSVSIAMENGGRIGEIVDIIKPLMDKAQAGEDVRIFQNGANGKPFGSFSAVNRALGD